MNTRQIARAAELDSLPVFRSFIDEACRDLPGMGEKDLYDLKLAVDEACTNIITHGYAGMDPGTILLCVEPGLGQVKITITDFGHCFEPADAPAPDVEAALDDRPTGGFGLFIIYQTMDEVDYAADPCGNRLTLVKHLQRGEKSGPEAGTRSLNRR